MRKSIILAICLFSTTMARASVHITLVPTPDRSDYMPGEVVEVSVFAQLTGGPESIRVRMLQFDISDTDASLLVEPVMHHPYSDRGPIPFWDFGGAMACANDESACGHNYFITASLDSSSPYLHNVVNITYTDLFYHADYMVRLNQVSPVKVGAFQVTMPNEPVAAYLDVLNSDDPDNNFGAQVWFGFGSPSDPVTAWTAQNGAITAQPLVFYVGVPEPTMVSLLGAGAISLLWKRKRQIGPSPRPMSPVNPPFPSP